MIVKTNRSANEFSDEWTDIGFDCTVVNWSIVAKLVLVNCPKRNPLLGFTHLAGSFAGLDCLVPAVVAYKIFL